MSCACYVSVKRSTVWVVFLNCWQGHVVGMLNWKVLYHFLKLYMVSPRDLCLASRMVEDGSWHGMHMALWWWIVSLIHNLHAFFEAWMCQERCDDGFVVFGYNQVTVPHGVGNDF